MKCCFNSQDREYRQFKDNQKKEAKSRSAKGKNKEEIRRMKEENLVKQEEQEHRFLTRQNDEIESFMKQAEEQHKQKVFALEHKFLTDKHQKLRGKQEWAKPVFGGYIKRGEGGPCLAKWGRCSSFSREEKKKKDCLTFVDSFNCVVEYSVFKFKQILISF